ncbi:MAG: DUF1592 domain-containing protein [Proteobacteria bacterium]|nr:DUF1592 domain-containing protein [Pseudomonadota bacterium]
MNQRFLGLLGLGALFVAVSCRPPAPEIEPGEPTLRRLTEAQYVNSAHDLLGEDVFVPTGMEPDTRITGLLALGAGQTALSPRGVENFEAAAYALAEQAMEPGRAEALLPCSPSGTVDAACAEQFIEEFGRRAWRRPLTADEVGPLVDVATNAADVLESFEDGLEFAIASLLMAPHFLYRTELGEADPEGRWDRRFSGYEVASRLSFTLWNTTPDDELLDAAEAGDLDDDALLLAQVERLMADPRARAGLSAWISDMLHLADLDDLEKDPSTFVYVTDTLGQAARTETLMGFEALAFDDEGDLRELATSRRTFVDRELAALYDLSAPAREGFGEYVHPDESLRIGLLGQASFLALNSHPVSTSPTLRGKFLQEVLLCRTLPGPPADVDTSIPEPTEDAPTLRDRVLRHLEDPACAGCHEVMDPMGLGLENFDGIGRFRTHDEGALIDASGDLDGVDFDGPLSLAQAIHDNDDFAPCLVKTFVRYSGGRREVFGELEGLDWLSGEFAFRKHRLGPLVENLTLSPLFRQAGALDVDTEPDEGEAE